MVWAAGVGVTAGATGLLRAGADGVLVGPGVVATFLLAVEAFLSAGAGAGVGAGAGAGAGVGAAVAFLAVGVFLTGAGAAGAAGAACGVAAATALTTAFLAAAGVFTGAAVAAWAGAAAFGLAAFLAGAAAGAAFFLAVAMVDSLIRLQRQDSRKNPRIFEAKRPYRAYGPGRYAVPGHFCVSPER